jgi:hypothetical protein
MIPDMTESVSIVNIHDLVFRMKMPVEDIVQIGVEQCLERAAGIRRYFFKEGFHLPDFTCLLLSN